MAKKLTGKTVEFIVIDKNGHYINNQYNYLNENGWDMMEPVNHQMTRKVARALKNFLNAAAPNRAPFRIAQTIITK